MTDTPSLASQLEELAAKATQGEWTHNNDFAEAEYISTPDAEIFMHAEWPWEYKEEASANVALVLALRNNVPAIIAGLRAEAEATELREENARLREVMERCAVIVERNNWRQTEKVDDVPVLLRAALGEPR